MLHTSLPLHIATGSYFPQHPAGELRSQPASRLPEHSAAARSPTRSWGSRLPAALPSPPGTSPEPRDPPGTCLSFPPRSISKMCLGDCFSEVFAFQEALPRNKARAVLGTGRRGRWIIFKLYSFARRTERDRGLLLGVLEGGIACVVELSQLNCKYRYSLLHPPPSPLLYIEIYIKKK